MNEQKKCVVSRILDGGMIHRHGDDCRYGYDDDCVDGGGDNDDVGDDWSMNSLHRIDVTSGYIRLCSAFNC